ncbi:MAG: M23 family metallopeptidase [Oscillospiraceae bacterium]
MTGRQIGARMSGLSRQKASRRAGKRKKETMSRGEKRRLLQLVLCGAIFFTLVAARLVLPQQMAQLSRTLADAIGENMDVTAVFSAVGRAISGEAPVGEVAGEVYQAVFGGADTVPAEGIAAGDPSWTLPSAPHRLRAFVDGRGHPGDLPAAQGETPPLPRATSPNRLIYSDLPKNVCMEQKILGFSYQTPVAGTLSSGFGYREHPVEGEEKFHYGIDIAADTGTKIGCFAAGTVTAVGESTSLGKYVMVAHRGDFSTLYAHCDRVTVSSGAEVAAGSTLAEVGETGLATGPHLHFELHQGSVYLNPIYYVLL